VAELSKGGERTCGCGRLTKCAANLGIRTLEIEARKRLYKAVKKAYAIRSKIVHGAYLGVPDELRHLLETEHIVRSGLKRILSNPSVIAKFTRERDRYLRDLCLGTLAPPD